MKSKFNFKHARKRPDCDVGYLAHLAVLFDYVEHTQQYCYIKYDAETLRRVGKLLPRGVGPHNPACIMVARLQADRYQVRAVDLSTKRYVVLEELETLPTWVKGLRSK